MLHDRPPAKAASIVLPYWSMTVWVTSQLVPAGITPSHPLSTIAAGEPAKTSTFTVAVTAPQATSMVCGPEVYGAKVAPDMVPLLGVYVMTSPVMGLP